MSYGRCLAVAPNLKLLLFRDLENGDWIEKSQSPFRVNGVRRLVVCMQFPNCSYCQVNQLHSRCNEDKKRDQFSTGLSTFNRVSQQGTTGCTGVQNETDIILHDDKVTKLRDSMGVGCIVRRIVRGKRIRTASVCELIDDDVMVR